MSTASTYVQDYNLTFQFESRTEPRYVRPKLQPNAELVKHSSAPIPTQADVDKFLYVSLYQSSFQSDPAKESQTLSERAKNRSADNSVDTSLYQDTYVNPRSLPEEMRLLDNKSNRTGHYRVQPPRDIVGVSKLLHLVDESPSTSYNKDFTHTIPIVEAGAPPCYAKTSHPLQTRQIVKKAFKYRRH
ncbi:hypothetical protein HDU76_008073 [Blyttiomyces sp. JEL0837]|nr:hypothetical protein HDU76_008073 [Blyttiomyces sp. JEL0837]